MAEKIGYRRDRAFAVRDDIGEAKEAYNEFRTKVERNIETQTTERWSDYGPCVKFAAELERSYTLTRRNIETAHDLANRGSQRVRGFIKDVDGIEFDAEDAMAAIAGLLTGGVAGGGCSSAFGVVKIVGEGEGGLVLVRVRRFLAGFVVFGVVGVVCVPVAVGGGGGWVVVCHLRY